MKTQKQNVIIGALIILLSISLLLNYLQGNQVTRLMNEIKEMEYYQKVLTDHIDQLEQMEEAEYGNQE